MNENERTYTVTEFCPHCENEITMNWNTEERGYKAFCPVCGNRLMLCDECQHTEPELPCGYDSKSDTCRFNQNSGKDSNAVLCKKNHAICAREDEEEAKTWFAIIRWATEDVIAAAEERCVTLTEAQAAKWWEQNENRFRDILTEYGNEVLSNMDFTERSNSDEP